MGEEGTVNPLSPDARLMIGAGALFAFVGVALGAFAAHILKQKLSPDLFAIFEVGVRYQIYHALALFVVAWMISSVPQMGVQIAGYCFIAGIVIFSGSLYVLSLTGIRWFGAVTPVGGLSFLAGWLWLAWAAWKSA